ncbi:MAG TPA: hypothetical protein VMF08_07900 [Candidatus Sulfotelmatobacter sp.]|nr:hypothetical protein [Candidatus Sulfotelmatobacter sp.]
MTTFPAYATNFELHPKEGEAARHLGALLAGLGRVNFTFTVADASVNQGQTACDLDCALVKALCGRGAETIHLPLPPYVSQELDFAFKFNEHSVAVEIEKANREKILRDILKCHIYLHAGADFAVIVLPRNYSHKHGVWNLFGFGIERYDECRKYGFGTAEKFGRIMLLGFNQHEATTNRLITKAIREEMRVKAAAPMMAT